MIRSFMITDDLEVQGQVKTCPLMPNVNTTLNYHPASSSLFNQDCNYILLQGLKIDNQ